MQTLVISAILVSVVLVSGSLGFAFSNLEVFAATAKVTICHKPGTPSEKTIEVPEAAVSGHLKHGDSLGPCGSTPPPPPTGELSQITCQCDSLLRGFCDATSCADAAAFCQNVCVSSGFPSGALVSCTPQPNTC